MSTNNPIAQYFGKAQSPKARYHLNGRPVEVSNVSYARSIEDSFITAACYLDGASEDLTEDELMELVNENCAEFEIDWMDYFQSAAEDMADYLADR